jgi:hypothetical protein
VADIRTCGVGTIQHGINFCGYYLLLVPMTTRFMRGSLLLLLLFILHNILFTLYLCRLCKWPLVVEFRAKVNKKLLTELLSSSSLYHHHSVLLFWKLLVFEFPLGTSETLLCSMSAPQVNIVLLLDALQMPNPFFIIIFYNGSFSTLKY